MYHTTATKASSTSSLQPNTIVDKVVEVYPIQGGDIPFRTKNGWVDIVRKDAPVHVGDTVRMELNTNGHSANMDDWYTEHYKVIKHGGNK